MPHIYTRNSEKALRQSLRAEMPSAESVLWSKLRRRQLLGYKFRRQYSVGTYVVDFYCAELRLAIDSTGIVIFRMERSREMRPGRPSSSLSVSIFCGSGMLKCSNS